VFQGTFERPNGGISRMLYNRALYTHIYVPEPNLAEGISLLEKSVALDPTGFCSSLELGNQYLKLGKRDDALRAYRVAHEYAPKTDSIHELLAEQVRRIESGEPLESISTLRNPGIE
jgi:tetratricopeptide (TPR) repeat protein